MVHALHEAWRVLVPRGRLVDLRPYNVEAPLEVVSGEIIEPVARLDTSKSQPDDQAADKAVGSGVQEGVIQELKSEYFTSAYYWDSIEDMLVDMNEKWKDDIVLPEAVVQKAFALFRRYSPHARLCMRSRFRLVLYEKQG